MQSYDEDTFDHLWESMHFVGGNFLSPNCPLHDAGRFYERYCEINRGHAILRILIDSDPENFLSDLSRGGYARRHFLARCARDKYQDAFSSCSRGTAFFEVVAGEDYDLANDLVALSHGDWVKGEEYEEDFCYVRFVQLFTQHGNSKGAELDVLLERFERLLDGDWSSRLDVCRALRASDGDVFTQAFESLLLDREREVVEAAPRAEEEVIVTLDNQLFIEGLALLRLAEREGVPTERQYPGCPALARRHRRGKVLPDPFQGL